MTAKDGVLGSILSIWTKRLSPGPGETREAGVKPSKDTIWVFVNSGTLCFQTGLESKAQFYCSGSERRQSGLAPTG